MTQSNTTRRVLVLANPDKPMAVNALDQVGALVARNCELIGAVCGMDARAAVDAQADRIIVLGGDGSLIGVARSLGTNQIPLIGVNMGKLGFLAEFALNELNNDFARFLTDDTLVTARMMLRVGVSSDGAGAESFLAVNDCVVQAGPPFRIIELGLWIDRTKLTVVGGDGLIVCTPGGSTGHNLSAGGPIMQPDVKAIVITPLSPHSLTHKPLVVEGEAEVGIEAISVNEGTTLIIDGQVPCKVAHGDRIMVRRAECDCLIVRNPRHTRWHKLVNKFHWGRSPNYG